MDKLFKQNLLYVFIQRLVPRGKSRSASFQIHSYFRSGLSNVPISFYLSSETSVCNLSAYSTLHSETLTHILPCGRCEMCYFFHDNYYSIDRYFQARRLRLLSSSCFLLVLASISLNFNSDLFSSMNFSHGRSN